MCRDAATVAAERGNVGEFESAVLNGVSANLCAAVSAIGAGDVVEAVDFAVTWASSRPEPEITSEVITFHRELLPILEEAGRFLRTRVPEEDFEVRGHVIRLHRGKGASTGTVTVSAPVEGRNPKISMALNEEQYRIAVGAHEREVPIACTGELRRDGKNFVLESPRDFHIISESS